ncbi:MAG: hypothetical protein RLZZ324_783 [Candidatus Parcubacteria bacterium]|jgi:N-acetylglucosaminyldiphosphoundecaprenol N-acetyl-beta-D-mannosaminyltransferase
MRIHILGIPIDAITRAQAAERMNAMLAEPRPHVITTPNPEMLVDASRDVAFAEALQGADLAIPDGAGLAVVASLRGQKIPQRISGTDFIHDVCAAAVKRGLSVFLLGGGGGGAGEDVAARAARELESRHPGLHIAGAMSGGKLQWETPETPRLSEAAMARVALTKPDILLVAFGHRRQELWIRANLGKLPSVRLAMGIGGAFDFIAGDVRRAPAPMRALGLEWLWRLILQPWRVGRIWKAVVTFPLLAFTEKR